MLSHNGIYSFVRLDGKQPELHLVFNIWEERETPKKTIKKDDIFGGEPPNFLVSPPTY
jgi:hypothetical protein